MANQTPQALRNSHRDKIYKLYKDNRSSMKELANVYGLSVSGIKAIIHNRDSQLYHSQLLDGSEEKTNESLAGEQWKKMRIRTNSRYEISNFGRIKSFAIDPAGAILKGKLHSGYLMFDYIDATTGAKKHELIHRLVALHFIGKPTLSRKNVIHLDGNKANNRIDNLKYVTPEETGRHYLTNETTTAQNAMRQQKRTRGQKLTLVQVERIRKLLANPEKKLKRSAIAERFGISEMTLYRIQNGDLWGNKGTPLNYIKKEPAVLTDNKVLAIKKLISANKQTQKAIAQKFGLSETVISRIKNGKTYKEVG